MLQRFGIKYRGNEIYAVVEAEDEVDALNAFLGGKTISEEINHYMLHPEFVEICEEED